MTSTDSAATGKEQQNPGPSTTPPASIGSPATPAMLPKDQNSLSHAYGAAGDETIRSLVDARPVGARIETAEFALDSTLLPNASAHTMEHKNSVATYGSNRIGSGADEAVLDIIYPPFNPVGIDDVGVCSWIVPDVNPAVEKFKFTNSRYAAERQVPWEYGDGLPRSMRSKK